MQIDDMKLLRDYATSGSEKAFAELVNRHVDFVYSAALRQTGNSHLAEEITQVVFIILARKAGSIRQGTILSGWLFRTTRFAANDALKKEIRRQRREQEAHMQSMLNESETELHWQQVSPLLDEALAQLGEQDRNAVLLRFFEKKNFKEVGGKLGTNEDAAKKRVSRAVDKLRNFFVKRGTVLPATVLLGVLSANSVSAAPVGLAATVAASATIKGTVAGASTLTLIKGTLEIMAWAKAKAAMAITVGIFLAIGATTVAIKTFSERPDPDEAIWNSTHETIKQLPPMVIVRESKFPLAEASGFFVENRLLCKHQPFEMMLVHAFNEGRDKMILNTPLPSGHFDYLTTMPEDSHKVLQERIQEVFGIIGRREEQVMPVFILKSASAKGPGIKTSSGDFPSHYDFSVSHLAGTNVALHMFSYTLQSYLKTPVIDETDLTEGYDIDLRWEHMPSENFPPATPRVEELTKALREQLGLELIAAERKIEMLIIERPKH